MHHTPPRPRRRGPSKNIPAGEIRLGSTQGLDDRSQQFRNLSTEGYVASYRLPDDADGINLAEFKLLSGTIGGDVAETITVTYDPDAISAVVCESDQATGLLIHNAFIVVSDTQEGLLTAAREILFLIENCGIDLDADIETILSRWEPVTVGTEIDPHAEAHGGA